MLPCVPLLVNSASLYSPVVLSNLWDSSFPSLLTSNVLPERFNKSCWFFSEFYFSLLGWMEWWLPNSLHAELETLVLCCLFDFSLNLHIGKSEDNQLSGKYSTTTLFLWLILDLLKCMALCLIIVRIFKFVGPKFTNF